jgi:hypothetical protein
MNQKKLNTIFCNKNNCCKKFKVFQLPQELIEDKSTIRNIYCDNKKCNGILKYFKEDGGYGGGKNVWKLQKDLSLEKNECLNTKSENKISSSSYILSIFIKPIKIN